MRCEAKCATCPTTVAEMVKMACDMPSETTGRQCRLPPILVVRDVLWPMGPQSIPVCAVHALEVGRRHGEKMREAVFELIADATWRKNG